VGGLELLARACALGDYLQNTAGNVPSLFLINNEAPQTEAGALAEVRRRCRQ